MYKPITKEDVAAHNALYLGSDEQIADVKNAYVKYKGNVDKIMQAVIGFEPENEDQLRKIIQNLIDTEEVVAYKKFTEEPPAAREKRLKRSRKEEKESEELGEKLMREGKFNLF
jgi:DnaJ family protein C protein 9